MITNGIKGINSSPFYLNIILSLVISQFSQTSKIKSVSELWYLFIIPSGFGPTFPLVLSTLKRIVHLQPKLAILDFLLGTNSSVDRARMDKEWN